MPFRERVRRALTRASSSNMSTSSLAKISSKESDIYDLGDGYPPPKYRRPVERSHKELLEQFDFATAWRRRSIDSTYSPMGSRMPSRRSSLASQPISMASQQSLDKLPASDGARKLHTEVAIITLDDGAALDPSRTAPPKTVP